MSRPNSMPILALTLMWLAFSRSSNANPDAQRHWRETESETQWTRQYRNCDYGYLVGLDPRVVGHGTHSPAPNHGFLVSLVDAGKRSFASYRTEDRYIWVDASYNSTDDMTLSAVAHHRTHLTDRDRGGTVVVSSSRIRLAGVPAIQYKIEDTKSGRAFVEEQVISLRKGIVYTVGIRTLKSNRFDDEEKFKGILKGFRFIPLEDGKCSND